jgi:glutamyl-Q tRNA(Asp) synthetase
LGSYLDARSHHGQWLIRIEDLDTPRILPGATHEILSTLARLGLHSDEPVQFQSLRIEAYEEALGRLESAGTLYRCSCSRAATAAGPYTGRCRNGPIGADPYSLRLRLDAEGECAFFDRTQGAQRHSHRALGDPILRRRDGQIAYLLAVVVDDAAQGITDVVRGADLLSATGWQVQISAALGLPPVRYAHLPVVLEADGTKLSKSRSAAALSELPPAQALMKGLALLRQNPPPELGEASVEDILAWAVIHWQPETLHSVLEIRPSHCDLGL